MILTITLNPSLDRVIWVDKLQTDDSVRIQDEKHYAGGKGIDASRVVQALGGTTTATGFLGSFNGLELEGLLINEGVTCDFIKIPAKTRSNVIIFTEEGQQGKHIALNSEGPEITPYDLAKLFEKLDSLPTKPAFAIIGGSIPKGLNQNLYAQIIYTLHQQGIKVALDTDNEALKLGLREKPFMIKPNRHEFIRLIGYEPQSEVEFIQAGKKVLQEYGLEIIMISRGARGLYLISRDEAYEISPPQISVNSTIGSGDSTLAAFILGLEQGMPISEAGIMGVAAGAATAMSEGVELVRKADYTDLLSQVTCSRVDEHILV